MRWLPTAVLLFGLWLLLVGTGRWLELLAGGCAAALAAAAQAVARRESGRRLRVGRAEAAAAVRALALVPRDLAVVLASLRSGRPHGAFRTLALPARGTGAARAARRVVATVAGSLPPNTIVLDVDRETGEALVHDLEPRRARREPA